jgi:glutaredoxin
MYNIFGLKWCIFCLRAINFMQEKGLEFHYHPMDNQEAFLDHLKEQNGHKTVPLITEKIPSGWRLIGGYDDLVKHIRKQEDKESNNPDS